MTQRSVSRVESKPRQQVKHRSPNSKPLATALQSRTGLREASDARSASPSRQQNRHLQQARTRQSFLKVRDRPNATQQIRMCFHWPSLVHAAALWPQRLSSVCGQQSSDTCRQGPEPLRLRRSFELVFLLQRWTKVLSFVTRELWLTCSMQ